MKRQHPVRRTLLWTTIGVVAAAIATVTLIAAFSDGDSEAGHEDESSPRNVGLAFIERYATGDGSVCDLTWPELRKQLTSEQRCHGTSNRPSPAATVFFEKTCADRTALGVELAEQGRFDDRYVRVSLEQDSQGRWLVVAVRAAQSRDEIPTYECATPSSRFSG